MHVKYRGATEEGQELHGWTTSRSGLRNDMESGYELQNMKSLDA